MKRYQVFLENPDGSGKGQLYEAETLERVWSWLDLTFSGDDVPRLWWVKDQEAEKAAAGMHMDESWDRRFGSPDEFIAYLRNQGWGV